MRLFSLLLLFFLLGWGLPAKAQKAPMTFERVTAEQGLTSNRINGIMQDQSGFIWIATNKVLIVLMVSRTSNIPIR
jgi:ligand-binding sensor domain-containing protein